MLSLLKNGACTRCGGDLSMERDQYGTYVECIQCGAVWNAPEPKPPARPAVDCRTVIAKYKPPCRPGLKIRP